VGLHDSVPKNCVTAMPIKAAKLKVPNKSSRKPVLNRAVSQSCELQS